MLVHGHTALGAWTVQASGEEDLVQWRFQTQGVICWLIRRKPHHRPVPIAAIQRRAHGGGDKRSDYGAIRPWAILPSFPPVRGPCWLCGSWDEGCWCADAAVLNLPEVGEGAAELQDLILADILITDLDLVDVGEDTVGLAKGVNAPSQLCGLLGR